MPRSVSKDPDMGRGAAQKSYNPERWRTAVITDRTLRSSVKIFLFDLSINIMDRDGWVSVPRVKMAERIDRSERTVDYQLATAVAAGYLVRVQSGSRGHTAVYVATIPKTKTDEISPRVDDETKTRGKPTRRKPLGERSLRHRLAAHASWAATSDPSARTAPARAAFLDRFAREVDPDGTLPPAERERRAASARKAHFAHLALKSAQVRASRAASRER